MSSVREEAESRLSKLSNPLYCTFGGSAPSGKSGESLKYVNIKYTKIS